MCLDSVFSLWSVNVYCYMYSQTSALCDSFHGYFSSKKKLDTSFFLIKRKKERSKKESRIRTEGTFCHHCLQNDSRLNESTICHIVQGHSMNNKSVLPLVKI